MGARRQSRLGALTNSRRQPLNSWGYMEPATLTAAASCHEPRQDGQRDLIGREGADVQANGALDAPDHVLIDTLGAQRLQVVASMAPASDQADEAGVLGQEDLQRPYEVGCVVVGVHGVDVRTEYRVEAFEVGDSRRPVTAGEALRPRLNQHGPEAHLRRPLHQSL